MEATNRYLSVSRVAAPAPQCSLQDLKFSRSLRTVTKSLYTVLSLSSPHTEMLRSCCHNEMGQGAFALQYQVQRASNSAELRSVASLRASIFFSPSSSGCSEFAGQSYLRTKAASMWEYLEEVTAVKDQGEKGATTCFYASTEDPADNEVVASILKSMDLSCQLPASSGSSQLAPSIVIGSLDLTIGPRLGGETLAGRSPPGQAARTGRAYICNVSVAPAARRQGVAATLIQAAQAYAATVGVTDLYVHVAIDNGSAIHLYKDCCKFELEQTEAADVARSLNRPKRLLLRRTLSSG